jgi:hypothetical protein
MTQEDIIRMAREAGFSTHDEMIWIDKWEVNPYMQRFAALVAAAENETCAKVCDHILKEGGGTWGDAIRARGQT